MCSLYGCVISHSDTQMTATTQHILIAPAVRRVQNPTNTAISDDYASFQANCDDVILGDIDLFFTKFRVIEN